METSGKTFDELIAAVKSKGGTTEAALKSFEENKLEDLVVKSLNKAKSRAKELSDSIV
jgi:pyrroline-5-carboxylate reductase